jgi:hypothetical protein
MQLAAITVSLWMLASQAGGRTLTDSLAEAKTLYAAAEYEEALTTLAASDAASETGETAKYRALCLLALGRTAEVDRVLEALVRRHPAYRLSDADVTPRLVVLFQDTRRRLLPEIVKDTYAQARATFDAGKYAESSTQLRALLTLLATDDAASAEDRVKAQVPAAAAENPNTPPPTPPGPPSDETLIAAVVDRYVRAYEALDADAVVQVFQGENPNPLRAAFDALKAQHVQARSVTTAIEPGGWSATVKLTWMVETVPKVGSPRKTQMPATFRMLKIATGDWVIVSRR